MSQNRELTEGQLLGFAYAFGVTITMLSSCSIVP
jgi:hypothetical protein